MKITLRMHAICRNALLLAGLFIMALSARSQGPSLKKALYSSAKLKLGQRFYSAGDMLMATVSSKTALTVYNPFVLFVSTKTGDAEALKLRAVNAMEYTTEGNLKVDPNAPKKENDGILSVQPGEAIIAYYYNRDLNNKQQQSPQQQNSVQQPDILSEFAFIRSSENFQTLFQVNKGYALFPNEATDRASTILVEGQTPVQVANAQVIYYSNDDQELKEFLQYSKGKLAGTMAGVNAKSGKVYLVEVPLKGMNLNDFGQFRQFVGYKQKMFASNTEALQLAAFCAMANLDGYAVSFNPKMQYNSGRPEPGVTGYANPPGAGETLPTSFNVDKTNIHKVWNFMAIWDRDMTPVNVGIVDMGFSTNNDFRNSATMSQCVANALGVTCFPNAAQGIPTVGSSLFFDRVWHGNAVVARLGGVINNNFGTSGTGGQVAVPNLVKLSGAEAYAFNIGGGIRAAVANGAQVINISGSFPCRALTSIGDFTYCDPGVRSAICAALFPIVETGAIIACSAFNFVPFIGPALAAGCIAIATTVYIAACVSQLALGNPGEVISQAVQFAKERGVPIVTCAGNIIRPMDLPADLRPFVNLDENRMTVDDWQIVPGSLPDVICVGAASPTAPFANTQFFGSKVDIWGPEDGVYMAPERADVMPAPGDMGILKSGFNGTSASTPFICGLVADAIALNPQLNRFTSTNVGSIVSNVRTMLVNTAWRASELPADPTGRRRNLVNPIEFLKSVALAAGSPIPTFSTSVYGNSWNMDATENTDDVTPTTLIYSRTGISRTGSIVFIPAGGGGATNIVDVDRFRIQVPSTYAPAAGEMLSLRLRTPTGSRFGNLTIRGAGISLLRTDVIGSNEEEKVFQGPAIRAGMSIDISVEGAAMADDNIYFLRVGNAIAPRTEDIRSITLADIGELCPTTLERGDREFGGGPLINVTARLETTADESGIDLIVTYRAEETGGDHSTATGEFRQRVFNAAAGTRVISISATTSTSAVTNFRGAGAGAEFGICNEGVVQDAPATGGLIRRIVVVGDTGGNDISAGGGCRCDTKIKSISFNPVTITTLPR